MTLTTPTVHGDLALRLANCLPGATFELEALIRLVDVVETTDVETAAVTTGLLPRLLINPDFVEQHCKHDEHLFLLVMHELWHILLGHTSLYPRPTLAHNIAFDAIINAGLSRQFKEPQFRGFFEAINPDDSFPARLLRPPAGWPNDVNYDGPGPKGTASLLQRLYPIWPQRLAEPTYGEILTLINRHIDEVEAGEAPPEPVLVGDHSPETEAKDRLDDPVFGDLVKDLTKRWPAPAIPIAGSPVGHEPNRWFVDAAPSPASNVRIIEGVLRRACRPSRGGARRKSVRSVRQHVQTPIPSARDRRRLARQRLGLRTVLWNNEVEARRIVPERPASAKVYLDVSGSMGDVLPALLGPLTKFVQDGLATASQFSTEVFPLPLKSLRKGDLTTTSGTDIDCVLSDALDDPNLRHIVVLTDGWVAEPLPHLLAAIRERGITVEAVIPKFGDGDAMESYATITRLVET